MANSAQSSSARKGFWQSMISVRTAAFVLIFIALIAVLILAIPRFQGDLSPEASPEFVIISKSDWWTKEEIPDGIGGDSILHVKVAVRNNGGAAGVCGLYVKVEEPGGRFWLRYRFMSISPGEIMEEQVDFIEIVDQNIEYSAWLS